ncbi:hypothetical protein RZS08_19505, partial [Arthrospira platensis SPKY1]|nr:hypothetical protein [Arthrospira platensis SPKY1]
DIFLAPGAGGKADAGGGVGRAAGHPEDDAGARRQAPHTAGVVEHVQGRRVGRDREHDGVTLQRGHDGCAVDGIGLQPRRQVDEPVDGAARVVRDRLGGNGHGLIRFEGRAARPGHGAS